MVFLTHMKLISAALFTLLLSCNFAYAQRDDCGYNVTPCEAVANADAIFVGKVTKIAPETISIWQRDKDYDQTARIEVQKTYKGTIRKSVVLHQLGRKNAPKFVLNSTYLFYANFDRARKQWEVRYCGRTLMAQYAHDDLNYLDKLPAVANKTRVAGSLIHYESDKENPAGNLRRLQGVAIRLIGEGKRFEAVTDTNGLYEFYDVPPGSYVVEPAIPAGMTLMAVLHYGTLDRSKVRVLRIEVKEGKCNGASIVLMPDGTSEKQRIG